MEFADVADTRFTIPDPVSISLSKQTCSNKQDRF
jgi:hypothetical protein